VNPDDIAPFARIFLRYLGAGLVSAGITINPDTLADPDVVQVVCILLGAACSAGSEAWYWFAKKHGWSR
jgi:hypothetical protein